MYSKLFVAGTENRHEGMRFSVHSRQSAFSGSEGLDFKKLVLLLGGLRRIRGFMSCCCRLLKSRPAAIFAGLLVACSILFPTSRLIDVSPFAEAAQETSPRLVALRNVHVDPEAPNHSRKALSSGDAYNAKQVRDLLSSVETALKSESIDLLMGLMDSANRRFAIRQKAKARLLFREFDRISGAYSDVQVQTLNDTELAVSLYCKVHADRTKDGRTMVLFDGVQNLTIKRTADTPWKICAID